MRFALGAIITLLMICALPLAIPYTAAEIIIFISNHV